LAPPLLCTAWTSRRPCSEPITQIVRNKEVDRGPRSLGTIVLRTTVATRRRHGYRGRRQKEGGKKTSESNPGKCPGGGREGLLEFITTSFGFRNQAAFYQNPKRWHEGGDRNWPGGKIRSRRRGLSRSDGSALRSSRKPQLKSGGDTQKKSRSVKMDANYSPRAERLSRRQPRTYVRIALPVFRVAKKHRLEDAQGHCI